MNKKTTMRLNMDEEIKESIFFAKKDFMKASTLEEIKNILYNITGILKNEGYDNKIGEMNSYAAKQINRIKNV